MWSNFRSSSQIENQKQRDGESTPDVNDRGFYRRRIIRRSKSKAPYCFNTRNDVRRRRPMPNDASMNAPSDVANIDLEL